MRATAVAIASILLSVCAGAGALADPLKDGTEAFSKKDYATAMPLLAPLAAAGDGRAQCMVDVMNDLQKGKADYAVDAVSWDCIAAAWGKPSALVDVGDDFHFGIILHAHNVAMAAQLYRLAADQGYALAQRRLAPMYLTGEGVDRDVVQACRLFGKVAAQNDDKFALAEARRDYGMCYLNGTGVPQDMVQALAWWGFAADGGDAKAKALWDMYIVRIPLAQVTRAQELTRVWEIPPPRTLPIP